MLRASWHSKVESDSRAVIANYVYYGPYVNYGHRQQPGRFVPGLDKRLKADFVQGQFFFEKGVDQAESIFLEELKKAVRRILKKG